MNIILNQSKCNFNVFSSNKKYFLFIKYHENLRKESLNTKKNKKKYHEIWRGESISWHGTGTQYVTGLNLLIRSQPSCNWYLYFQKTKTTYFPLINPTTLLMYIEFSAIIKKRSRTLR